MEGKYRKALGRIRNRTRGRTVNVFVSSLALLGLLTFLSSMAMAQTGFSDLRGNITDESGAVVAGALITLTEPATGVQVRTSVSDAQGNFEFPNLKPGTYQVKSEMKGFKAFVAEDILLDAGQTRRFDIRLSVGNATDVVEVHAGAALINTEGGTISGQLDTKQIEDTPLIDTYPSPLAMFATLPGVQGNGWDLKISGQDANEQSFQMDGVSNDRAGEQANTSKFVQEATVTTVNAPADSARLVAYNLTSKRGQNEFHGMAYYQHFNAGLNAIPHNQTTRTAYIQHDWQAELAGPIWKNRTFFYFSWYEQLIPLGSFNHATVPTQAMWNGDFTGLPTITDPQTGQPFPNNKIPANRISSVAAAIQQYFPLPNIGDPNVFAFNNFGWTHAYAAQNYRGDWPFFRIDHNLTSKNSIFVRWLMRKTPFVLPGTLPSTFWTRLRDHRQTVVTDTHVFSPKVLNVFRFGYNTDYIIDGASEAGQKPLDGGDVIAKIGLQGVNPSGYNVAGVPTMTIDGGLSKFSGVNGGVKNDDRTFSYEDSLTWEKGRHIWKFGGDTSAFRFHSGVVPDYGSFTFSGAFTGGNSDSGFADFLLGLPFSIGRSDPLVNRTMTSKELGLYAEDTFKLTPRLTLDYGLRWDYYAMPTFTDGLMYNFDPATGTVLVPQNKLQQVNPLYPAVGSPGCALYPAPPPPRPCIPVAAGKVVPDVDPHNFRPRISAAYRLGKDFVIRGGYGQFTERYSRFYSDLQDNQHPGPFAHLSESFTHLSGQPPFSFPNPFPSAGTPNPAPGQSVTALPRKWYDGTIHQYNLSIEKEVAKMGLRASYVGSRSVGLNFLYNSYTYSYLNVNVLPASAAAAGTKTLPFPNLSGVYEYRDNGEARYNALELEASRKQGWVTFDAHYTLASSLNNIFNTDDVSQPTKVWAVDHGLRRNLFTITSVWTLPFGKGRKYMNNAPRVVDALVGGWGLQTISYFGSGDYMTPFFYGFDVANNNFNSYIPDVIPGTNGNLPGGQRSENRWFNTPVVSCSDPKGCGIGFATPFVYSQVGAFKVPGCPDTDPLCLNTANVPPGRFGNAGFNTLIGPRLNVHHLSVAKTFHLTERVGMTFTTAISDLFNHPHFYDPDTYIQNADAGQLITPRADYEPEKAGHRQISFKLRFEF